VDPEEIAGLAEFSTAILPAAADVSSVTTSTNGVRVVVEGAMWWPGTGVWQRGHSSARVTHERRARDAGTAWIFNAPVPRRTGELHPL
jgi:hypothetical protein